MTSPLRNLPKLTVPVLTVGLAMIVGISIPCFADYETEITEPVSVELSSAETVNSDVTNCAMQYLGCPYSWGGEDPYTGFDCSGFVYYVYLQFGVELNRTAEGQALCGESISPTEVQAGDVLCFYSEDGSVYHSGIYIGNGLFIHSDSTSGGVVVSTISGYYSRHGYEVRRMDISE